MSFGLSPTMPTCVREFTGTKPYILNNVRESLENMPICLNLVKNKCKAIADSEKVHIFAISF
jgi:hypothetical protein